MKNTIAKPFLFACVLALALCSLPKEASAQNLQNLTPSQVQQIVQNAQAGDAQAQSLLAHMYFLGRGVPQDYKLAAQWYQKAAEQGDRNAQSKLSSIMQRFQKTAEQGHPPSQFNLGSMYEHGRGVPRDYKLAVQWFQKAAEQGYPTAQFKLGSIYYEGLGVPQDYKQAIKWYRMAAKQGDASAQNNLGRMYHLGKGVPQNNKLALQWYRKAALQGYPTAQGALGRMYHFGRGAPQDDKLAYIWLSLVVANGGAAEYRDLYDIATQRLSPQQLEAAQREAASIQKRINKHKK